MKQTEFLKTLTELMQRDTPLQVSDRFQDIEEWDSMSMMVVIAYFDTKLKTKITFKQLGNMQTIADLLELVPGLEP